MQFFTSGIFWFFEGLLFCLAIAGLRIWTEDRNIPMPLWKWVLVVVWILFAGFTIAFIGTSLGEHETTAAIWGGLIFGIGTVICFLILLRVLGFLRKS